MPIDQLLEQDFIRVTEHAAIAAAHTMGFGDRHQSDQVAVEAMRRELDQTSARHSARASPKRLASRPQG